MLFKEDAIEAFKIRCCNVVLLFKTTRAALKRIASLIREVLSISWLQLRQPYENIREEDQLAVLSCDKALLHCWSELTRIRIPHSSRFSRFY